MIKYVNVNWSVTKILNIFKNVHPEALAKSDGNTLCIFGERIYADSDGVYDKIIVYKSPFPIIGGYASMNNLIDHCLWMLNKLYKPLF